MPSCQPISQHLEEEPHDRFTRLPDAGPAGRGPHSPVWQSCPCALRRALEEFKTVFGCKPNVLFSAPGRTELGGNHTDHQRGCVLAAAVDLDILAARLRTPADKSVSSPKAIPSSLWT